MIKVPKEMIISKIKEKTGLSDKELEIKVKDKLDQLSGLISEEGALHIIANELGVKVLDATGGKLQVKNVLAGMRNVTISAKVIKIYEVREFDRNGKKGKVGNFLVGDETGVIRVVAWNEKADLLTKLSEGDLVEIENGYSRENQGKAEVHLGDKSQVKINSSGAKEIEVKPMINQRKKISDLLENESSVEIIGTIVQVFDPRFFSVDPESGKRAVEKEGSYYVGDQQISAIDYSYVTNIFLDDGTENVRVVLWKNQTQNLFGMSHEEIMQNKDIGFEDKKNDLLGQIVKFVGRTNKNEMFDRVEFVANFVDVNPDTAAEIKKLEAEVKEAQATKENEPEPEGEQEINIPVEDPKPQPTLNNIGSIGSQEKETQASSEPETVSINIEESVDEEVKIKVSNTVEEITKTPEPKVVDSSIDEPQITTKIEEVESIDEPVQPSKTTDVVDATDDSSMDEIDEIDDIEDLSSI